MNPPSGREVQSSFERYSVPNSVMASISRMVSEPPRQDSGLHQNKIQSDSLTAFGSTHADLLARASDRNALTLQTNEIQPREYDRPSTTFHPVAGSSAPQLLYPSPSNPTASAAGPVVSPPLVVSDIIPHVASTTDGIRAAKQEARLKLQDLASDLALYNKEKRRFSKDRRTQLSSKQVTDLTVEEHDSPVRPSSFKNVLGPRSGVPSKQSLSTKTEQAFIVEEDQGSGDDSEGLNMAIQSTRLESDLLPLEYAPSGRAYNVWDDSGQLKPTYGVLLPDGYQKSSDKELTWICPVRTCRTLHPSLPSLGSHFSVAHRTCCLNDNLDGTFTEISKHGDTRGDGIRKPSGDSAKPPIVVSTGHLSVEEFPLSRPKLPAAYQEKIKKRMRPSADSPISKQDTVFGDESIRRSTRRRISEPSVSPASPIVSTSMATPGGGRTYTMWRDYSGKLVTTCGALIPDKYTLDHSLPGRPVICPVRSCRRLYGSMQLLGQHFQRTHRGCRFNDNGDGTLSLLSTPEKTPGTGDLCANFSKYSPPTVISTNTLDPSEPPILPPQKPYWPPGRNYKHGKPEWINVFDKAPSAVATPSHQVQLVSRPSAIISRSKSVSSNGANSLWEYIRQFLGHATIIPDDDITRELLLHPRKRDLHWNPEFKGWFLEGIDRDILSMIIQVTGEAAKTPCSGCRRGLGPFAGCVVVSSTARAETVYSRWQCANCIYEGHKVVTCSIKQWSRSRTAPKQPAVKYQPCTPHRQPKLDKEQQVKSTSKRIVAPSNSGRSRSAKKTNVPQRSVPAGTIPRRGGPRRSGNRRGEHSSDGDVFTDGLIRPSEVMTADYPRATHQNPVFGNLVAPPAFIPMQDWEFAPGLIHSTDGERRVIAYSEAALRSELTLATGLAFRIIRLEAGALVHLQADADNTLQCVLSIGVIQVKIGDEEEFTMGGHGLFLVRPGVTARVQNKVFTPAGAVLHVTKIAHLDH